MISYAAQDCFNICFQAFTKLGNAVQQEKNIYIRPDSRQRWNSPTHLLLHDNFKGKLLHLWIINIEQIYMRDLPLLSSARSRILASLFFSCILSKQGQLLRLVAVSSQLSVLMSRGFMSRLQTSLYHSLVLP